MLIKLADMTAPIWWQGSRIVGVYSNIGVYRIKRNSLSHL